MTRADAIKTINATLAHLDDEKLNKLIEVATALAEPLGEFRFSPAKWRQSNGRGKTSGLVAL